MTCSTLNPDPIRIRIRNPGSEEGRSLASLCIAGAAELSQDAAAVGGRLAHLGLTARHAAQQARQEHLLVLLARRAFVSTKTNYVKSIKQVTEVNFIATWI